MAILLSATSLTAKPKIGGNPLTQPKVVAMTGAGHVKAGHDFVNKLSGDGLDKPVAASNFLDIVKNDRNYSLSSFQFYIFLGLVL